MIMQSSIRRQMLLMRRQLSSQYIEQQTLQFNQLLNNFISPFSSVAIYAAIDNELSVYSVVDNFSDSMRIALPKINTDDNLEFVDYEDRSLWRLGKYNILEPATDAINYIPGVYLVPLTAIDSVGVRVGMGKGYYDRYLKPYQGQSVFVGVGWDFQLSSEKFIMQSHDVTMDYFISPSGIIKFNA